MLLVQLRWAMLEPRGVGRVTVTVSHALFVFMQQLFMNQLTRPGRGGIVFYYGQRIAQSEVHFRKN